MDEVTRVMAAELGPKQVFIISCLSRKGKYLFSKIIDFIFRDSHQLCQSNGNPDADGREVLERRG